MSKKVIEGDVDLMNMYLRELPSFLKDIDEVYGSIVLTYNKLKSIKNCPSKVIGSFFIDSNRELDSLNGSPSYVSGDFVCRSTGIKNLFGCPQRVDGRFYCDRNNQLINLEGCPRVINIDFDCSCCNNLQSFEGGPEIIKGDMTFVRTRDAKPLLTLKGFPKFIEGDFYTDEKSETFPFTEQEVRAVCEIKGKYKTVWI